MTDYSLLINGKLVPGAHTMPVINPATEEVIAECPRGSVAQLNEAVAAAKAAFPTWSATPIEHRRAAVKKAGEIIDAHAEEFARLLTTEQGKPLPEATGELAWMSGVWHHIAGLELPMKVVEDSGTRYVEAHRKPLGVIGAILPWNFPMLLLAFKLPAALIAGNTMVIKPAPTTPLGTLRFAELIKDVFPPGVLNFVADANDLGDTLTHHPDVRKISFTGSSATGKKVMSAAAEMLKRITLELGGNDAAIVLDDADVKSTAAGVYGAAFNNAGQVCLAIKRAYVHESIYDKVCDELASLAKAAVVDDGIKQGTTLGPLQNKMQYEKVKVFLEDAKKNGNVIAGGSALDRVGYFIAPTIVRDVKEGSRIVDEEQFGPVLPVIKYSDPADAVRRANATTYGLGGSVWGTDAKRAYEIAKQLDAGTVWVNKHLDLAPNVPFGGSKQSGLGTELAAEGLHEFTQLQIINAPPGGGEHAASSSPGMG
jgi:acyl-CoA reductase-like NAD-dependent aldehyde dehydrogenase